MSQLLPLLFALACPLGMAAMMAGPALARRYRRPAAAGPAENTDGNPGRIQQGVTASPRPAPEAPLHGGTASEGSR